MPELPEVETTRSGIAPYLEGVRVNRVIVRERRLRWPIPEDLDVRLSGQRFVKIERRAKYLLLQAESGTLISHLGMSGSLRLVDCGTPVAKHEHVDIELESGLALRYTDPRRFGALLWSSDPLNHELLRNLGPEPLTDDFDGKRLYDCAQGRNRGRVTLPVSASTSAHGAVAWRSSRSSWITQWWSGWAISTPAKRCLPQASTRAARRSPFPAPAMQGWPTK